MKILIQILLTISLISIQNKFVNCESNADILNSKVERTIDLSSHLAKVNQLITVENKGTSGLNSYTFVIEPTHGQNVVYISAHLGEDTDEKNRLTVSEVQNNAKGLFYKITFNKPINSGKTEKFSVEYVLRNSIKPYPIEIQQNDRQLVLFNGNTYYYSQYQTKTQTTKVELASDKVESFTQLKPTSKSDSTITYGAYENVKPFEQSDLTVHYENTKPFLTISNMIRVIELSHWGNIAVEETIDMYHSGAKLKGSFSRFDFMRRQGGASAVKSFKTILPASANSVYYRDEIGNISTSNLRGSSEQMELELRPRFPLFGGWRTHYTVGYNVPSYQYLFNKGSDYSLKMKLIDHVYDDQLIEHLTVKIILPEHSKNIDLITPYKVQRGKNDIHYTYLDTVGRPVVVIHIDNAVDNHIQDFELRYTFPKLMILQEPLLVIGAFYLLFTVVIILVRVDFSITKDSVSDARLKVQAYWEQINSLQEKRDALYNEFDESVESFKATKGGKTSEDSRKKVEADLKQVRVDLDNLANRIKSENVDIAEKISHINKADQDLYENKQSQFDLAQKLVKGSIPKDDYVAKRKVLQEKAKEISIRINSLIQFN